MPIPADSRGEWPRPGSTAAGEASHDSMRPAAQQTMAHDTGRDDRPTAMVAGEPAQTYLIGPGCEVIPMGQIGRTFLVAQVGSELHVIDQHTAHERVLYERLWRAWQARGVQSQPLLIPEPVDLPPHGAASGGSGHAWSGVGAVRGQLIRDPGRPGAAGAVRLLHPCTGSCRGPRPVERGVVA